MDSVSVSFCLGFIKPLATHILQLLVILNFFRQMSTKGKTLYFVMNPQSVNEFTVTQRSCKYMAKMKLSVFYEIPQTSQMTNQCML